jgi:hypothetical protein
MTTKVISKLEVKKQLRALGIKIFKNNEGENFVQKGDIKKALASLAKKK